MKKAQLKILLEKYEQGTLTDEESKQLEQWDAGLDMRKNLTDSMSDEQQAKLKDRLWENINARIDDRAGVIDMHPAFKKSTLIKRMMIAASILLLISAGGYLWLNRGTKAIVAKLDSQQVQHDIQPGGDKAILTLADGTKIVLEDSQNGMIAQQGNAKIVKLDDGQIEYELSGNSSGDVGLNLISTPKGGQYKLTLPDGSKVWLNASSSLQFPAQFTGSQRKVTVTGEAYFEVVHDASSPFVVAVNNTEIHDVGTAFNVNAYPDESGLQATLVSGLIDVKNDGKIFHVTPGKAAMVNGDKTIVRTADVEMVTSWKNGMFQFQNADIKTIMRQVQRWYNVDVKYEGNIADRRITGKVQRNSNLSEMLKILELSEIHFRLNGNKVTVTP